MSYRIEYQWASWKLTAGPDTGGVDRFVVAIEGGDNNLRDAVTGKRARSWEVCMLGSAEQVLKQAVYFAGACEGGSLKPGSRDCSPEAYIRRIRRLIEDGAPPARGPLVPVHPSCRGAPARDLRGAVGSHDRARAAVWRMVARVSLSNERRNLIFDFADRFPDLRGWQLAAVSGLPAS
jgi:hypothetical protein